MAPTEQAAYPPGTLVLMHRRSRDSQSFATYVVTACRRDPELAVDLRLLRVVPYSSRERWTPEVHDIKFKAIALLAVQDLPFSLCLEV